MRKNILVFPCGSEVALEIHRSLRYSAHFHLVGASSVPDHGRFVYRDYVEGLPFHSSPKFIENLRQVVKDKEIDAIYPAMDAVARTLKEHEPELGCRVIGSGVKATSLCASKIATYSALAPHVMCPAWWERVEEIPAYPVFIKPDEGYGSRGTSLAKTEAEARYFSERNSEKKLIFCEWLPGKEYTIDCFSDQHGNLLFSGARGRQRISNGISVSTFTANQHQDIFRKTAQRINDKLRLRGAWFFQMKEDQNGAPKLLEVAARLGGSSGYFRAQGVNFALLSCFDAFDYPVEIQANSYPVELDRALGAKYRLDIDYETVYVDYDDCLIIEGLVNSSLVSFLFQALNRGKRLVLLTRHDGDINDSLREYRLDALFDHVVHLRAGESKSSRISPGSAIFIDDSHSERAEVAKSCRIPVFAPDMVEMLQE